MKSNLKSDYSFNEDSVEISITEAEKTKKQWDKIDKKELKKDTKKEKEEHEKDAIQDDKSKIKKLEKGKPSEKKDAEKKALKKDMKFDKNSKKKMEGDAIRGYPDEPLMAEKKDEKKIKPKKSYAQMLTDIAAERFGKKKEVS